MRRFYKNSTQKEKDLYIGRNQRDMSNQKECDSIQSA